MEKCKKNNLLRQKCARNKIIQFFQVPGYTAQCYCSTKHILREECIISRSCHKYRVVPHFYGTHMEFGGKKKVDMKVSDTSSQSLALFPVQFCTNQPLQCYK
jgi:hypothetical protein